MQALAYAGLAHASETEANDTSSERTLETIIVTGKQTGSEFDTSYAPRAQNATTGFNLTPRETPQSVTVLTRQLLDDQQIETIDDVFATAPGITSNSLDNAGRTSYRSRGFNITNYKIDGMEINGQTDFSGSGASMNLDLYDNVQIVRGANGLMGGSGDPSATIYLTRKQAHENNAASISATYGSHDKLRFMADGNLKLTESGNIRTRLVVSGEDSDTFREREHIERKSILWQLGANLTPNLVINGGVQYQDTINRGASWGANVPIWFADGSYAYMPRSFNPVANWSLAKRNSTNYFANIDQTWANGWRVSAGYDYTESESYFNTAVAKVNNGTGGAFAGFMSPDGTGAMLNAFHSEGESKRDNAQISLSGPLELFGRTHELMFGASGYDSESISYTFNQRIGNCGIGDVPTYNPNGCQYRASGLPIDDWRTWNGDYDVLETFRTDARTINYTTNYGVYGAARLNISDNLKFIGGVRLSDYKTRRDTYTVNNDVTRGETSKEQNVVTPYAGIVFDASENISLYASYTDVFSPQGEVFDANDKRLDPTTGSSYEAGIKGEFADGLLNTSFAVFKSEKNNVAEDTGLTHEATSRKIYRAVDGVSSSGFDFEVFGQPLENWNLLFGYTYLDVEGMSVRQDARHVARLSTSYTLPGALERLTIGGGVTAQSSTVWSNNIPGRPLLDGTYDTSPLRLSGYALVNVNANYKLSERISIGANISNLTDKTYYTQYGFYGGLIYGEPRTASVTVRARF